MLRVRPRYEPEDKAGSALFGKAGNATVNQTDPKTGKKYNWTPSYSWGLAWMPDGSLKLSWTENDGNMDPETSETGTGGVTTVEYHAVGNNVFPNGETTVTKTFEVDVDGQVIAVPAEAVPVTVAARVKDTRYGSLAAAFAAAQGDDTIMVLSDCDGVPTLALPDRGAVTLDLNGHVVEGDGTGPFVDVSGATALTIVNGDVTAADALRQTGGATLVAVNGAAVVLDGRCGDTATDDAGGTAFQCADNGTVKVNGGAVFGRLEGDGFTVNVYTNGDRFASVRFTQDETEWLSAGAKRKRLQMEQTADGLWSVDRLLKLGMLFLVR